MDVKKAIMWVLGIIIVVGLGIVLYNIIFQTNLISDVFSGIGNYVNDFWKSITGGHGGDIFDASSVDTATGTTINW